MTGYSEKDLHLLFGTTALTGFAETARSADRVLRRDSAYQLALASMRHAVPVSAGARPAEPYDLLPQRLFNDPPRANGRDYEPEPLIGILARDSWSALPVVPPAGPVRLRAGTVPRSR